jgi:formyltetrahydrofolate deformylase
VANRYVLTLSCPDRPGIVAAVASTLANLGGNILESQQFDDSRTGRFFMRVLLEPVGGESLEAEHLHGAIAAVGRRFDMDFDLRRADAPYRTILMVSKFGHCLNDLLFRWRSGGINMDVAAIVSNHPDLEPLARSYGVDYHHIPVTPSTKVEAEERLMTLVDGLDVDLVVLARYMQILSADLTRALSGRIINIHHSFLPSFKGAKPYHQAYERGVKLIGATAHYVTADLDEGPIIEQDAIRADHRMLPDDLVRAGEECEARVLARALRWHCESRVLVAGDRTVVFS